MIRLNTIKTTWQIGLIFFFLLAQLLISCSDSSVVGHVVFANDLYNFEVSVKTAETSYRDGQTYPSNVTFVLKVADNNREDLVQSLIAKGHFSSEEQAIHFLSFGLPKSVSVKDATGSAIKPLFFHFERSFDLKKERVFLTSFDLSQAQEAGVLSLLIDSPIFGEDAVVIDISKLEIYKS